MDQNAYETMANTELNHWFWLGRRQILLKTIRRFSNYVKPNILELGSGSGGNTCMLDAVGTLTSVEMNHNARQIFKRRHPNKSIYAGHLPGHLPNFQTNYDLVCLFDVLEHIDKSCDALVEIRQLLSEKGCVFITVPAYQWMWSDWDDHHHHHRRYTRQLLINELESSGFKTVFCSHFNTTLFPLIVLLRLFNKLFGGSQTRFHGKPHRFLNSILEIILGFERHILTRFELPFGLSIIAVAMRHDT